MTVEAVVAMMATAITGLVAAIGILWRAVERRTDAQVSVATESIKTMLLLQTQITGVDARMAVYAGELEEQIERLSRALEQGLTGLTSSHAEMLHILREMRATIIERQRMGVVDVMRAMLPTSIGGTSSSPEPSPAETP